MPKISIGVVGFNEEYGIGRLLESLQEQTLLKDSDEIEVIVVSNGSYDNTVSVAKEKLLKFDDLAVKTKVVELELADKCAAWNHFIHQASCVADYYILLDADILLINSSGLQEMIELLVTYPECRICGAKIVNQKGVILDRIVDGKCYAAPGHILRNVAIPNGIVMDDAYIAVTVVTNWYETDFEQGLKQGYVKQTDSVVISCGETRRDQNISYWIACRKRTIVGHYTQKHMDYYMRDIFGGGEQAKNISMQLFHSNPNSFLKYLNKQDSFMPSFTPPVFHSFFLIKEILQYLAYCYCYILAIKGIKNQEFGHLAWKLKHRYW